MDPSTILTGVGTIASLFGNHKPSWNRTNEATGDVSGIAGTYRKSALGSLGLYDTDNTAARDATNQFADYLRQDPYTDTYSNAGVNSMTQGLTDTYNHAMANNQAQLARRGIAPNSSQSAGAVTALNAARAGAIGNAQNAVANQRIANRGSRMSALSSLLSGQAGTDYSRGMGALGGAAGQYDDLLSNAYRMDTGDQAASQQQGAEMGGMGSLLGQLIGRKKSGGSSPFQFGGYGSNVGDMPSGYPG